MRWFALVCVLSAHGCAVPILGSDLARATPPEDPVGDPCVGQPWGFWTCVPSGASYDYDVPGCGVSKLAAQRQCNRACSQACVDSGWF